MGTMINRRRVMGSQDVLPYGAVPIEYLESTGTQYIDCNAQFYNIASEKNEFIVNMKLTPNGKRQLMGSNGKWYVGITGNYYEIRSIIFGQTDSNFHTFSAYALGNKVRCSLDNIERILSEDSNAKYYYIYLFDLGHRTDASASHYWCTGKVKWAKIIINDNIIRDFIPVRIGNVGYMYDKVSGQLFGNQGTGSFILGPDV